MLGDLKESVKDFSESVKSAVTEKEVSEEDLDPVLETFRLRLMRNNVSLEVAEEIENTLRDELVGSEVKRRGIESEVKETLSRRLDELMDDSFDLQEELARAQEPPVVFLTGFNGSGKTTTAAKLCSHLDREAVLGAGDTFRAASIEQLQEHGENLDTEVITHEYESDPAAVAYDTVEHAENEGKTAIVDTAGRSHSDTNLMDELEKMVDVNDPDVTFLVVDALAGNDVLEQAEAYEGMFDAIIVTKMDVDEKGGAVVSLSHRSGKPVAFLGTGQEYGDLEEFDREEFIESILED